MDFNESKTGDFTVLQLTGKLGPAGQKELLDRLLELFETPSGKVIIDCSKLTYISSSGLRVLLMALKKSMSTGGDLRLCGVHTNIRELMVISGFTSIFNIYEDQEEASL
jgi:anti-sigma B factor antagonist